VKIAYKKYKQNVYYDQLNLFQRKKLADFECSNDLEEKLKNLALIIDKIKNNTSKNNTLLDQYIKEITFNLIPKTIKNQDDLTNSDENIKEEHFLTNKKSSDEYYLEGTNFFINAPVELHLISVIWLMKAGVFLESEISDSCYGYRLNDKLKRPDDKSSHLFKMYNTQYQDWRNNALNKAEHILNDEKKDIAILSLDFKHCFYCISTDFDEIHNELKKRIKNSNDKYFALNLTEIVKKIHIKYKDAIKEIFRSSHHHIPDHIFPLPIGFVSSGLLCNWHLRELDAKILRELNPDYYGRYVDDILIVMSNPVIEPKHRIQNFMQRYFCETKIFQYDSENKSYNLVDNKYLQVQEKKLILHFFSVDHSHALLDSFKQKVDENASAFFFLPEDDLQYYINETAYNLLFDGSTNKWRNIIGIVENVTELSKNLTKIITSLTQSKIKDDDLGKISDQLFKFYKGKNFINFCRTWEKLFSFTIMTNQQTEGAKFYLDVQDTILKISKFLPEVEYKNQENSSQINEEILLRQKNDLSEYLFLAISIPLGLLGDDQEIYLSKQIEESIKRYKHPNDFNFQIDTIRDYSKKFRQSNLIRHNYIAYPLINYTDYGSSLINWDKFEKRFIEESLKINKKKIDFSPRFIHFDEYYLFQFLQFVLQGNEIDFNSLEKEYRSVSYIHEEQFPISIQKNDELSISDDDETIEIIEYCIPKKYSMITEKPTGKLKVGVANVKITNEDIYRSYHPLKKPNLAFERQKEIFSILNQAKKGECDLLVLPELSIPYRWLPFMVKHARNHQMALIFGMEYWVVKKPDPVAYNFIVAALPIKNNDDYKTCGLSIRCKNHYAPKEQEDLERAGLSVPNKDCFRYDLFKWRGCQFSIYNCYEVADIKHRAIFRSELDLLVACVLNKDTNYFSSIVESVVKDLHCYVVQVNCSDYGDSRIVQPTKKDRMDILRVSGGDNNTILTAELDINKLRHFQSLGYSAIDDEFKPTPPGFDRRKVKKRGTCPKEN
jgi:hypothetical protein